MGTVDLLARALLADPGTTTGVIAVLAEHAEVRRSALLACRLFAHPHTRDLSPMPDGTWPTELPRVLHAALTADGVTPARRAQILSVADTDHLEAYLQVRLDAHPDAVTAYALRADADHRLLATHPAVPSATQACAMRQALSGARVHPDTYEGLLTHATAHPDLLADLLTGPDLTMSSRLRRYARHRDPHSARLADLLAQAHDTHQWARAVTWSGDERVAATALDHATDRAPVATAILTHPELRFADVAGRAFTTDPGGTAATVARNLLRDVHHPALLTAVVACAAHPGDLVTLPFRVDLTADDITTLWDALPNVEPFDSWRPLGPSGPRMCGRIALHPATPPDIRAAALELWARHGTGVPAAVVTALVDGAFDDVPVAALTGPDPQSLDLIAAHLARALPTAARSDPSWVRAALVLAPRFPGSVGDLVTCADTVTR